MIEYFSLTYWSNVDEICPYPLDYDLSLSSGNSLSFILILSVLIFLFSVEEFIHCVYWIISLWLSIVVMLFRKQTYPQANTNDITIWCSRKSEITQMGMHCFSCVFHWDNSELVINSRDSCHALQKATCPQPSTSDITIWRSSKSEITWMGIHCYRCVFSCHNSDLVIIWETP